MTIQIYVSTYAKYNKGSIGGAWIDLEVHNEESFTLACLELHKDEQDPELMFQDIEGIPNIFYSESSLDSRVWEWLELDEHEQSIAMNFLECFGDCAGDIFEAAQNAYQGTYDSDSDFAYEMVESLYNLEEPLASYFDYERYARDLMVDYSSCNGMYFNSNW